METAAMWNYRGDPKPQNFEFSHPFVEPDIRSVTPAEQVAQIVSDLQSEGMTGVVERTEILRRYPEYCWMHGWIPHAENHLFEALGKFVKRVRPFHKGQRITGYVIPNDGLPNQATQVAVDKPRKSTSLSEVKLRRAA
jgi:hypothetical protein